MRLIDADLLLSCIGDRYTEKKEIVPNNLAEGFVQVEKLIKEQPAAYDVDRVIEQLKAEESRYKAQALVTDDVTDIMRCCMGESAMQTAIEIVKAGGMVSEAKNMDVRR